MRRCRLPRGFHFDAHHLIAVSVVATLGGQIFGFPFPKKMCPRALLSSHAVEMLCETVPKNLGAGVPVDLTKTCGCVACCEGVICDLASDH